MENFKIDAFQIRDLNSAFSVSAKFEENRLILIGENGTSKSTVLSILYFTLSRQWEKLHEFDFSSIKISLLGEVFDFSHQELQSHVEYIAARRGVSRVNHEISKACKQIGKLAEEVLDAPSIFRVVYLLVRKRVPITESRFKAGLTEIANTESDLISGQINNLSTYLAKIDLQLIFLPTYRRIERDLKAIFPDLEEAIQEQTAFPRSTLTNNLVELVEFGMEDVQGLINGTLDLLRRTFQTDVNNLFGEYLRDVLRGNYASVTPDDIQAIDSASLDAILSRLDEHTLPANDRINLRKKVNIFRTGSLDEIADQVVAHFLVKLHSLQRTQFSREEAFRGFVELCNSYLVGKSIEFDSVSFTLKILLSERSRPSNAIPIELANLSSGEKQVISLFAHLALGSTKNHFILIDEPELSLSVPWQKRFLKDISNTNRCVGFFAVTHSPFIYDNELAKFAHGINEFIEIS